MRKHKVKKTKNNQVLVKMWRKWNSHTLLMGIKNGGTTFKKFGNTLKS